MFSSLLYRLGQRRQLRELESFISALSTMSDSEMSELLLIVTDIRHTFAEKGSNLLAPFDFVVQHPRAASDFAFASHTALKGGSGALAAAHTVWGHTCRATTSAQLLPRARLMWRELARGSASLDATWRRADAVKSLSFSPAEAEEVPIDFR